MKTTFFLPALLCLCTSFATAQDHSFEVGAFGGGSYTDFREDGWLLDIYDFEATFNYVVGLHTQLNISDLIGIRIDPSYSRKSGTENILWSDVNGDLISTEGDTWERRLDYVVIPLLGNLQFGSKIRFNIFTGPYLGILLNQRDVLDSPFDGTVKISNQNVYATTDFGISGGASIEFELLNNIGLEVAVRNDFGLSDVYQNNNDLALRSLKTNALNLFVGGSYYF